MGKYVTIRFGSFWVHQSIFLNSATRYFAVVQIPQCAFVLRWNHIPFLKDFTPQDCPCLDYGDKIYCYVPDNRWHNYSADWKWQVFKYFSLPRVSHSRSRLGRKHLAEKWLGEKLKQSGFLELLSILRKVSAKRKVCLGTIMFYDNFIDFDNIQETRWSFSEF